MRYLSDEGYSLGMIRDQPSWQLPAGATYDQLNMLNDVVGIARQRGGSTALVSGAQTAFATSLGFCVSQNAGLTIEELYGVSSAGAINLINKTTGATTALGAIGVSGSGVIVGRPVQHFGFVVFPWRDLGITARQAAVMAGVTVNQVFTNAVAAQVAANDPQVTLTGADVTTNVKVGTIVQVVDATHVYQGRVVSIDTTKKFTVWPPPNFTNAAVPIGGVTTWLAYPALAGSCAASFQNRLLFGNTIDNSGATFTQVTDRRIYYSPLPTESTPDGNSPTVTNTGAYFVSGTSSWPKLNFVDVPGTDPIVAMQPLADNELLILTSTHPVVFRGNLVTQLATTSPTITFDLSEVNQPAGCLSDLSVQRTARGIVWAGAGGVFAHNGRSIVNLTGDDKTRRIASLWQSLASDAATFVIHGSAYVRDHYIVSGTSGGTTFSLACNMQNLQWTRLSGVGTDNFFAVSRPTIPQQVFGLRWWDQSGAAPSMTNGQTLRLESMLAPYVAGATKTDADGTAVSMSLTTRVMTGDAETQKLFQRGTVRAQVSSTTVGVAVTGQSKIDAADIDASSVRALGNLSNTATLTVSNATNANPIVVTTGTHGLQSDDFVDIDAVGGNLNANGRWRIAVINSTSFSLVGGIGSAAYTSGGKVKKVTETDYLMSPLNSGQGASLTIAGSPNNIELHGVRLAVLEKDPVMSA
jgi:hypothetical protein